MTSRVESSDKTSGTTHRRSPASLQSKLLSLLVAILVPVLLVQAGIYYRSFQRERAGVIRANLELARAVARLFEEFVRDVLRQERALGIALAFPGGLSAEQLDRLLNEISSEYPALGAIHWVDPRGLITVSTETTAIGLDLGDRSYVQEILADKNWAMSDLSLSKVTGQPNFSISQGIRDETGNLLGIVVAAVLPERLNDILAMELSGAGTIFILDRNGNPVCHYPKIEWTLEDGDWGMISPLIHDALLGKEIPGALFISFDDREQIIALTPIRSVGWVAGVGRSRGEVMAPVISDLLLKAGLFFLVVLAVSLLGLAICRRIVVPIRELRQHALALGQGELQHPVVIGGSAELQDLADGFNLMAAEIRLRQEKLESIAQECAQLVIQMKRLVHVSTQMLAETTPEGLLRSVVQAARDLTGARLGTSGHGYREGVFRVGYTSRADHAPPCPPGEVFRIAKGGVYLELIEKGEILRLTDQELRNHRLWWGLPEGHTPLRGLLGSPLKGHDGRCSGLIMVSDKNEGDFTAEDETLLAQLASIASLGLQHIEARRDAETMAAEAQAAQGAVHKAHDELESRVQERTAQLVQLNKNLEAEIAERERIEHSLLEKQEALRQSEKLLRTVLDTLPVGVAVVDRTGRIIMGNPAAEQIWAGLRDVSLEDYGEYKGWRPDTGKRIEAGEWALARALRTGETSINEVVDIECFDGTRKTIFNSAAPIRDDKQEIIGAIVVNQDITEQKLAEEKIGKAEAMLKTVFNGISEPLIMLDKKLSLTMINEAACKYYRIKNAEAMLGKPCYEITMGVCAPCDRLPDQFSHCRGRRGNLRTKRTVRS